MRTSPRSWTNTLVKLGFRRRRPNEIRKRRVPSRNPQLELLEPRQMLTVVTTLIDEDDGINVGAGTSLREAIKYATDNISFAASLTGRINLTQGELAVTRAVAITGPGADKLTIDAL